MKCADCRWWRQYRDLKGLEAYGVCFRFPPSIPFPLNTPNVPEYAAHPATNGEEDYCGEFSEKETGEK